MSRHTRHPCVRQENASLRSATWSDLLDDDAVSVTPIDVAKAVAAEHGYFGCTDEEADFALRERTGFPDNSMEHTAEELDRYFSHKRAAR